MDPSQSKRDNRVYDEIEHVLSKREPTKQELDSITSQIKSFLAPGDLFRKQTLRFWLAQESGFIGMEELGAPVPDELHILENFDRYILDRIWDYLSYDDRLLFPEVGIGHLKWLATEGLQSAEHIKLLEHGVNLIYQALEDNNCVNLLPDQSWFELESYKLSLIPHLMNVNISNRQVAKAYDICAQLLVLPRREHTREIIEASKNIFIQLYPTIRESTLVGLDAEYIAPTLFEYNSKCNLDDELIQQITALSFENPLQWNANINEDQEINDHELMLEAAKRLANSALTQISAKNPTDKDLTFWATYLKTIPLESTLWLTGLKTMEALDRPEYIRALSTLVEDCCKGAPALLQLLGLWADYQYNFFFPAEDFYEDLREILLELNLDKRNDISRKIAELSDEQLHIMGQTASVSLDMQQLDRLKQDVLDFFAADPPED